MVSTRGLKQKFSVGEKVLCYEPDPLKAKVLYNSKVLKILDEKESSSKKGMEFLIHFSGWNSTWDRYVTEDYILKDTEENRKLQQQLAEKAQLTPGGNLYKRERHTKKHQHRQHRKSTSSSHSNTTENYENGVDSTSASTECSVTSSSLDEVSSSCSDERDRESNNENINTEFPPTVRGVTPALPLSSLHKILFHDSRQIKHCNMVVSLPASPNVIEILDGFYRQQAYNEISAFPNKTRSQHENTPPTLEDLMASLNVLDQIIDGVRIYFDAYLNKQLLYSNEKKQHEFYHKNHLQTSFCFRNNSIKDEKPETIIGNRRIKTEVESETDNEREESDSDEKKPFSYYNNEGASNSSFRRKRLRDHSNENGGGHCSNHNGHGRLDSVSSAESVISSTTAGDRASAAQYLVNLDLTRSIMLQGLEEWEFVPRHVLEQSPPLPAVLYGAVHLARLLIKLPEILTRTTLTDDKLEFILEKLNILTEYLVKHDEWFRPNIYVHNTF